METLIPQHRLLVIKTRPDIRRGRKTLYHAVRWAWRIDPQRAANAEYVLGCVNNICHGVFIADEWKSATAANFPHFTDPTNRPDAPHHRPERHGFDGREAAYNIQMLYADKKLPEIYCHGQNRIRYINC